MPVLEVLSSGLSKEVRLTKQSLHGKNFHWRDIRLFCSSCGLVPFQARSSVCKPIEAVTVTFSSLLASSEELTIWDDIIGSENNVYIASLCQVLTEPIYYSGRNRLPVASWILNDEIHMSKLIGWH